jgi:hypothetical protein
MVALDPIGSYGMRPRQIVSKDPGQRRRHCGVRFTAPIVSLSIPTVNEGDYRGTVQFTALVRHCQ